VHILVLDGSRVLLTLVKRLAPPGVEVEFAATFDEALKRLALRPPQALIVDLTPADLPWAELHRLCSKYDPPIPVLYESCIYHNLVEAGLPDLDGTGHFLEKPYSVEQLGREIEHLVRTAGGEPVPTPRLRPRQRL
jgi:DNA-binding NtrC family response regulator